MLELAFTEIMCVSLHVKLTLEGVYSNFNSMSFFGLVYLINFAVKCISFQYHVR